MTTESRVETYPVLFTLIGRPGGRRATKVTLPCGTVVRFAGIVPDGDALRFAADYAADHAARCPAPKE